MRRILDLRIIHWGWKTVYVIVVAWLLPVPGPIAGALGFDPLIMTVVNAIWLIAAVYYGSRIFRGRGEAVTPPRPRWQMTARAKLSRRLGYLFFALTLVNLLSVVLVTTGVVLESTSLAVAIVGALECGALAFLYLNSAIRLRRRREAPTEPTFKPRRLSVG